MDGNPHNPSPLTGDVPQQFQQHEDRSQKRYEMLSEQIKHMKASDKMGMDNLSDKINVNVGGSDGAGGGLGTMAAIAALGGRNEQGAGALLPLAASMMNRHDGYGAGALGAGALGFVAGSLIGGRGRGGLFGGGDGCEGAGGAEARIQTNADTLAILAGINRVGDNVSATGATNTINLLQQTNEIQQLAAANAALISAGTAATERSVTNTGTVLLQAINTLNTNVLTTAQQTQAAIVADGSATRALINQVERDNLLHERNRLDLDRRDVVAQLAAQRTEVNVTQTVTQTARADAQANAVAVALTAIDRRLGCLEAGHNQIATAVNRTIQFGTGNVAANNNTANNANA